MEEQVQVEEKKKNKVSQWIEDHPKAFFWIRFASWFVFACALPFSFVAWRFDLFKAVSKIQFGGWGIIAIVIVAVFAFTIIKYVKLAFSGKYSLIAQILDGFCKIVLPLLLCLIVLYSVRDNVILMIQVLGCVTICETVAIPLNPLPKWAYEKQKDVRDGERKDTVDYILDSFFKKKSEHEAGGE